MSTLEASLKDPTRPTFLHGLTPPLDSTTPDAARTIAAKFVARSRVLASDGFIVYDIQDEPSRSGAERPYPFRQLMDSASYAAEVRAASGKECLVYKCVNDAQFEAWVRKAKSRPRPPLPQRGREAVGRRPGEGADHQRGHGTGGEDLGRVLRLRVHPGAAHGRVRATTGQGRAGRASQYAAQAAGRRRAVWK